MDNLTTYLPIASLLIAALAVFFGPLISIRIGSQQVRSSMKIANKQIVAPMRQAWINDLRNTLAELFSLSIHYFAAGYGDRSDAEYARIAYLEQKIRLMLNPREQAHVDLESLVEGLRGSLMSGREGEKSFQVCYETLQSLSRQILKQEWDRVKEEMS